MITYLGAVALGFVLGAVFSAVGLLADRKGALRRFTDLSRKGAG